MLYSSLVSIRSFFNISWSCCLSHFGYLNSSFAWQLRVYIFNNTMQLIFLLSKTTKAWFSSNSFPSAASSSGCLCCRLLCACVYYIHCSRVLFVLISVWLKFWCYSIVFLTCSSSIQAAALLYYNYRVSNFVSLIVQHIVLKVNESNTHVHSFRLCCKLLHTFEWIQSNLIMFQFYVHRVVTKHILFLFFLFK